MRSMKALSLSFVAMTLILQGLFITPGHADREAGWVVPPEQNPDFVIYDLPPAQIEKWLSIPYDEMVQRRGKVTLAPPSDTLKALVFLCQWDDHLADTVAHPPEVFDTLLFTEGVVSTGSMREFFLETSYGDLWGEGGVHGWFTQPTYISGAYFTDFFAAADPFIDYSEFDRDGDGYTDAVWIFHAGPGQEETHNTADIWSFAVWGLDYMTDDGVIIDRFACNPEEHADGSIISIRVPAHEAGHVLGLPDLYDYNSKLDTVTYFTPGDANDHPMVDWGLMGYYGYNIMSFGTRTDPSHFCAWSKEQLGFLTSTPLTSSQKNVPLPEVNTNPFVYKVTGAGSGSQEYFLLENRNSASTSIFDHLDSDFSAYWPWFTPGQNQKDSGLLIYHVDDAVSSNSSGSRYKVTIEDAGYDPARPWDGTSEFSDWWYPYEMRISAPFSADDPGQGSFTPNTTPNSDWYGGGSGIWITNISESGENMTFDIGFGNAWPAIVDHAPAALDTQIVSGEVTLFSADVLDEDGDASTYEWYVDGSPVQSGSDSTYSFLASPPGAVVNLLLVATDGSLADSLGWSLMIIDPTGVADAAPAVRAGTIQATPTPFNPSVRIRAAVPSAGHARLTVHDPAGRLVAVLADGHQEAGLLERSWLGKDLTGNDAASGIYFVRLVTRDEAVSKKILLLR